MRNKQLLLALVVVLLLPTLSGAATLDQLTATADCNTWGSETTIVFRPGALTVLLVFSMQLADSAGVEMERFDSEAWLEIPASLTAVYPFGAAWAAPLEHAATMTVTASVYDSRGDAYSLTEGEVIVALACPTTGGGLDDVAVCRHASRWWLRHASQWPVASMMLGGMNYDAAQIARLLRAHHHGQINRRLAHQLAVAKLNLANGAQNEIADHTAAADSWLAAHPLESSGRHQEPRNSERREGLRLIKDLNRWNHGGCPDGSEIHGDDDEERDKNGLNFDFEATDMEFTGDLADYDATDKAGEETINLGTLKAMFR